jgi:hypothetical protein
MQTPDRRLPPAVIFDSSLDESVDQIFALAMTLAYVARQDARLGSISVSRNSLAITSFCELIIRFYRGEQPGESQGRSSVTIGMSEHGNSAAPSKMVSAVLERTGANNTPLYVRTIAKLNDTADPVAVMRNALSAQQDQSSVVILAGPPVNLLRLLAIPEGKPMVQKKARSLVIGAPLADTAGFTKLLAEWPGPITIAGDELRRVEYPAAAIDEDFAWAPNHPIVDAYRAAKAMPYNAPIGAMAAVLHAIHPEAGHFSLSDAGTLTVSAGGRAQFNEASGGRHRMLLSDASRNEQLVGTLRPIVAARPEARRGGRGG